MATIVTRAGKGSPLSFAEGDANFTNLNTDLVADIAALAAHIADTADAHAASAITNTPAGTVAATTVQAAINELDTEKAPLASPALTGTPTAPTAAAQTNTTQLATTAFVLTQAAQYVHVGDRRVNNTQGGGWAAANAWAARPIQTEVSDVYGLCTVSSNQITLTAGTYYCRASAPFFRGNGGKFRLRNVTAGTTLINGPNLYSAGTDTVQCNGMMCGLITVAASQALEFQVWATLKDANTDTNGYGASMSGTGEQENYADVEFWRIS
jgi:hypothetical protein